MSTRNKRALTSIESLLLAQAVWELGAADDSWTPVAKILAKHPLLSRPKAFFTPQSCHTMYETLMQEAGLELNESNHAPHASTNLQLAQKHYRVRFFELQELILAEESKFKTVLKEIEDIRAGLSDKATPAKSAEELPSVPDASSSSAKAADEAFSGSDLSGVTDSPDSNHSPPVVKEVSVASPGPSQIETPSMDAQLLSDKKPSPPLVSEVETLPSAGASTDGTETVPEIEELTKEDQSATETVEQEEVNQLSSPVAGDESHELLDHVEPPVEGYRMEDVRIAEQSETLEEEDVRHVTAENADQRQEEEEEEIPKEQENKEEEEEEAPQGQEGQEEPQNLEKEESSLTEDSVVVVAEEAIEKQDASSPKSVAHNEAETESEIVQSPANGIATSEPEHPADEGRTSEIEEPTAPTRRSTRRRKSSVVSVLPPQTRTRVRSHARAPEVAEAPAPVDSENEGEAEEIKEETPAIDDEQASSLFDGTGTKRRNGKRKASFLESAASPPDKKRLREDSEPVDEEETGPSIHNTRARVTRHATRTEEQVALKRFQNVIGMLHSQISQHRNGNIFHNPIKNSEAPDYHDIVKRPMDLKTIKTRVKDGVIANSLEYQRDIYLMFANAMMYNRPGSDVHAMAEDMMLESEGQISSFRQTEGLVKRGQRP
ncbi:hypothetical protein CPB84DRAFT_1757959 [Gymnopilus junonius]|uniref:Bromo domain-containing protein n=1 Tax=Gymnopilus junonius TaxID=109634 RepID=A0A9P5TVR4_GYMJU|nr:hypothetical protein CPB84DRAFT_1757959 [Gymnopilus junonius]